MRRSKKMAEEEMLPDIPNILMVLEETLADFEDMDDLSKITKRQLALNQQVLLTSLIDLAKFNVAKGYILEILDKAVARISTSQEDPDDEETIDAAVKGVLSDMKMFS